MAATLESLAKKIAEGKATDEDIAELAILSTQVAKEKAETNKPKYLDEVKALIEKRKLDVQDVIVFLGGGVSKPQPKKTAAKSPESSAIFKYEKDGFSFIKNGLKGKVKDSSIAELKTKLPTKEEAMKFALDDDGKIFVERIYGQTNR